MRSSSTRCAAVRGRRAGVARAPGVGLGRRGRERSHRRVRAAAWVKIYRVGGSVRDELLGLPVKDHDYVVVGSDARADGAAGIPPGRQGFPGVPASSRPTRNTRSPAPSARPGAATRASPVYAAPEVTLEQDLARRDLTINAIARDEHGTLIDPFWRRAGSQARRPAPRQPGVRRRPGAHPARGALRRPLRLRDRAGDAGAHAPHGAATARSIIWFPSAPGRRLSRGLMERAPVADVRDAARLRRAGAHPARVRRAVRSAATTAAPSRDRHRLAHTSGDRLRRTRGFRLPVRFAALTHDLGKATTPREQWPRHHRT